MNNLLIYLSPEDPDEAGRRYRRLHQKLTGFFQLRGVADPTVAADEALNRAAIKMAEEVEVSDINGFCLGIARSMLMEGSRQNTRESTAFLQFLEQHKDATDRQTASFNLMKTCFEKLPQADKELLDSYCIAPFGLGRPQYLKQLAERLNTSLTTLSIHVTKLRRDLDTCVKESSKSHY